MYFIFVDLKGVAFLVLQNDYVLYLAESERCSIFGTSEYCIWLNNWYFDDIFQVFQIERLVLCYKEVEIYGLCLMKFV